MLKYIPKSYSKIICQNDMPKKVNAKKRRVRIKRVINHPNYFESNKEYPRHDIALLETIDELYNSYSSAAPACLPQTARTMGETEQIMDSARGLDCFVAGYGQIAEKGPASSFLKDTRDSNMKHFI